MTTNLTREQYHSYMSEPMRFIKDLEELAEVDLFGYLSKVLASETPSVAVSDVAIEYAAEDGRARYQHIAVGYGVKNEYLVVVTDKQKILGHHLLDLNKEYGLKP